MKCSCVQGLDNRVTFLCEWHRKRYEEDTDRLYSENVRLHEERTVLLGMLEIQKTVKAVKELAVKDSKAKK